MKRVEVLERLRGGLIVSIQAAPGSALDDPTVLAAMALAAADAGAAGVRIQGVRNLQAVRRRVALPIVGIIKRGYEGYEPYITPTLHEVREVLDCGADVVAFDATARPHPPGENLAQLVAEIHDGGALAMADCSGPGDGPPAKAAGADILATTLCGYTPATKGRELPALDVVRSFTDLQRFVICEGGIHTPEAGRAALDAGADAIVVGTAITNVGWLTAAYASALRPQRSSQA